MDALLPLLEEIEDTSTTQSYLSHLISLSLAQILEQEAILQEENAAVRSSLISLCQREVKSFGNERKTVLNPLDGLQYALRQTNGRIPVLDSGTNFDAARLSRISKERRDAATLSRNLNRLEDLLELPSLIRICVQNGYYSEATDLAAHLRRTASRYPQSNLMCTLLAEVEELLEGMYLQLISLLRTPLRLAIAMKVIGFLRRSMKLEENELRYLFLKGRYDHLNELFSALDILSDVPERYLKKYIEVFREQVFTIITQYNSIFTVAAVNELSHSNLKAGDEAKEQNPFGNNILPSFAVQIIGGLQSVLQQYIAKIQDTNIRGSILTQILYTSQSLARVGVEFGPQVVGLFAAQSDFKMNDSRPTGLQSEEGTEELTSIDWIVIVNQQKESSKRLEVV